MIREALGQGISDVSECVEWIVATFQTDIKAAHAGAVPFLMLMGVVCGGWQMARAALAANRMLAAKKDDASFCEAKIISARFYADHVLSRSGGLRDTVVQGARGVMALGEDQF